MQGQIAHETEIHRQHIRLRIPIGVEIDGTRFVTDDWSLGGFGVAAEITSRQPGERFPVRLFFPFEDFEIVLPVDCQMVYVEGKLPRFGCKFIGLSKGQLDLFRYLVDAYLSGEIVSAGDVLAIAARENGAELRVRAPIGDPFAEEEGLGRRLRRILGYGLLLMAAVVLAGLVAVGVREKFFVVKTEDAVVWVPVAELRAPFGGKVEAMPRKDIYAPGDAVVRVRDPQDRTAVLESPCECVLLDWLVPPGQYARTGEAVAALAAADRPLLVRARLPVAQAARLEIGQRAEIYLPGRSGPVLAQIERIDFKPGLAALEGAGGEGGRYARVVLRPDRPFDFEDLGTLVRVRFI